MERSTLTPNYVFNVLRVRYSSGGVSRVSPMRMYDCVSPCVILLLPRFPARFHESQCVQVGGSECVCNFQSDADKDNIGELPNDGVRTI